MQTKKQAAGQTDRQTSEVEHIQIVCKHTKNKGGGFIGSWFISPKNVLNL